MKKSIFNSVILKVFTIFSIAFLFIGNIQGTTTQNDRKTDYQADQVLKSNAKINPSTLALEFAIPIGGFMGRGGAALPVVFNYSSKVWQIYSFPAGSWQEEYGTIINDTRPLYAKRTAAGWTSNLGTPRIDYEFQIFEPFRSNISNYDGQVWSPYIPYSQNPPLDNYNLYYIKRVQVTMPDGSTHEFRKDDTIHGYGTKDAPGGAGLPDITGTFLSVDGSRMRLDLAASNSTLFLPDGSRYLFGAKTGEHKAHTFIDRNGNKMTYNATSRTWTDTLGRTITDPMPSNWQPFEQAQVVEDKVAQFPGKDGGTYNVTFSWRYLKDPQGGESGLENTSENLHYLSNKYCQGNREYNVPGAYLFNNPEISITRVCAPGYSSAEPPPNPIVLTKITLPNGQNYQFKYNVFGEISKIIYPTGGYERFQHAQIPPVQGSGASYDQANRGVVNRWVSVKGDGTDEVQWTYSATLQYQQPFTVTTTAPDGTKTQQYLYWEGFDEPKPYGFGDAKTGRSYEDRVLSPTNQLLRRNLTKYITTGAQTGGYAEATRDMRPEKQVSIIFEPNESYALAQLSEMVYDTNSDPQYFAELNAKQSKVYKYKVLNLSTAQTANIDTIAAMFSSADLETVTEIDYLYDANYKARNITGLPMETRIKDAGGSIKAKSQIFYDESAYSIIDYGTTTNWENPNTNYRGNPTTTRSWYDISNNLYVEIHAQYDNFGNQRKTWDGLGNLTQTEYSSTYLYAYPTKITSPIPDPTGQKGANTAFETTTVYDYNTALPTKVTDANGLETRLEYVDALLRPTKVSNYYNNQQVGARTETEYGAGTSEATRWVKVKTQIDETNWKQGYTWFDGLGRVVKTQSVDSSGDIFVETEYDNMSRPKRVTNPYRTGDTKLWTESFYDDLSRVTKVKTPDNAEVLTAYSLATSGMNIGTVVTVTDQAGKLRRSVTNALGQLKRVDEPNDSNQLGTVDNPNQYTTYGYDILNNLTTVSQGVQTRSFVYDALSRLKSATNPEMGTTTTSGTISYSYDNNGNLTQKVDARNIQTNYSYDALNRVKTRSYANESGYTTPTVNYYYDNLTNAKGKLIKVSSAVSTTEYTSFDSLGRVIGHKQTTDGNDYTTAYTYNLSGALIEETYPSTRVVRNTLDANGDLAKVESKKNSSDYFRNYANSFVYTAAGAISSMKLGNGKFETTSYNSRLQPVQISLGSSIGNTNLLKLNYDYGTTDNNGNVKNQEITVQRSNQSPLVFSQTYSYDSLNRLKQAVEMTGTTQNWKQTYTFDRYGNRNFDTANTTTIGSCTAAQCNPQIDPANNRFTTGQGYTYDLAGNLLTDAEGRSFTYDAENKQKTAANTGGTIGQYFYDGDGKRVKKITNTETVIFVYDALGKLVAEYSTLLSTTPQTQYLTNDNLGTPRINTNALGTVVSRSDYMPYGEEIIGVGNRISADKYVSDDVRQGFTGYIKDDETGLDFAEARMYMKGLGRFSTTDPILLSANRKLNPQEINLYVYVKNNPLAYIDPLGEGVEFAGKNEKERAANEKYYNDYKEYVKNLPDSNPDKAGLLATIKQLEESSVTYVINVTTDIKDAGSEVEGKVEPNEDGTKIMVNIRNLGNNHEDWSLNSRFAHELEHARQFDSGEIGFAKDLSTGKWSVTRQSYDSFDEVNAYRASVAIAKTNGKDNTNPKLRSIISDYNNAKGDKNKELEAYRRYKGLDDKDLIRQNNVVRYPDKPSGWNRFEVKNKDSSYLVVICNGGCSKK